MKSVDISNVCLLSCCMFCCRVVLFLIRGLKIVFHEILKIIKTKVVKNPIKFFPETVFGALAGWRNFRNTIVINNLKLRRVKSLPQLILKVWSFESKPFTKDRCRVFGLCHFTLQDIESNNIHIGKATRDKSIAWIVRCRIKLSLTKSKI